MVLTLITYPGNKNAWKALVAARFHGVRLEVAPPDSAPAALRAAPLGKLPLLLVPHLEALVPGGVLFEAHAIARYVARLGEGTNLLGEGPEGQALVDAWIDFSTRELDAPLLSLYLPLLNVWHYDKQTEHAAKDCLRAALRALDAHLEGREYLVGAAPTLADIVVACDLFHGFTQLFDEPFRAKCPHATAHFQRCLALPEFKAVVGEAELCRQPLRHGGGRGPRRGHGAEAPAAAAAEPAGVVAGQEEADVGGPAQRNSEPGELAEELPGSGMGQHGAAGATVAGAAGAAAAAAEQLGEGAAGPAGARATEPSP